MTKSFSLKAMLITVVAMLASVAAFAQQKSISGTVKGEDGAPVPGVTVMIKGTTVGTSTGVDGKYSFTYTQNNPVLAVSCIGYEGQEVEIGGRSVIDFVLVEENTRPLTRPSSSVMPSVTSAPSPVPLTVSLKKT